MGVCGCVWVCVGEGAFGDDKGERPKELGLEVTLWRRSGVCRSGVCERRRSGVCERFLRPISGNTHELVWDRRRRRGETAKGRRRSRGAGG